MPVSTAIESAASVESLSAVRELLLQVSLAPDAKPTRPVGDRCVSLRRAQTRTRLAQALAIATFTRIDGPRWLAYSSQRDYARGRLGLPWARFARLRRLGSFLLQCPSLREALDAGAISFSVADELALGTDPATAARLLPRLVGRTVRQARGILQELRAASGESERRTSRCQHTAGESERRTSHRQHTAAESERRTTTFDPTAAPDYERVSFAVPSAVAHYVHQSLELAGALLGADLSESDCVDAIVAEASTEIRLTTSADEARRRFRGPRRRHDPPRPALASIPEPPRPRFRRGDRRAAIVLDRYLRRLLRRQTRLQVDLEDALLELHTTDANRSAGFPSLVDFARDHLDLARSTLYDYLQRARQRRLGNPIATALADGALTPVKAQLLHRLRRCHVPASCLPPWVEQAQRCTTRRLDRMIRWARMQGDLDYRAWSLADFPPPTSEQLRASNQPVETIASDPEPKWLLEAEQTLRATIRWVLATETLDLLLQLMAAVEDRHHATNFESVPAWWCLLRVFATARREWSVVERQPNTLTRRILRRDDYRCAAPNCSRRRSLEVHHIRFRSAGGKDEADNLVTLCALHHHQALHQNVMRIRGHARTTADDLTFELGLDENGRPTEVYRGEMAL